MRIAMSGLAVAVAAALAWTASAAPAGTWRVEAENYVASNNILPDELSVVDGVLYGLDAPGEWTRYDLPAIEPGRTTVLMKCWGLLGVPYELRLDLVTPGYSPQSVDLNFIGRGSCGT